MQTMMSLRFTHGNAGYIYIYIYILSGTLVDFSYWHALFTHHPLFEQKWGKCHRNLLINVSTVDNPVYIMIVDAPFILC